ncbi:MAG: DUF262 domain-containing protein [Firmicutes bacterium]|nr:DUF262 domain-containing protein [Bacillota bacterium]
MSDILFINDLIQSLTQGHTRIPSFQRGFVWDPERVARLMDSIYRGYPFGTLLFWRTRTPLQTERSLGPFTLPANSPEYPIDYILDGQQRATSIFGVFQTEIAPTPGEDDSWSKIYFDIRGSYSAQDSQFVALSDDEVDPARHFPLKVLFNSPEYWRILKTWDDEATASRISELWERFKSARIRVQYFNTDDRTAVAIVFERINRMGVELDTLQLLSAWSWSEDFDLQAQFEDLADELAPFGFNDVGEDSDLLLRCCAAIIAGDVSPKTIINLNGSEVRKRFDEVRLGILGAIDFLRNNLKVLSTRVLPYTTIIIPLSVFFSTVKDQSTYPDAHQHQILTRWIWRTFFTRRYSKRLEQLNTDIGEIRKLRNGEPSSLGEFSCALDKSFFLDNAFNLRNVNTKTFVLMLASGKPLDFINGSEIALDSVLRDCNKKEFHHMFPIAYLKSIGVPSGRANILANLCILARASNNKIGDLEPSTYKSLMPDGRLMEDILASAFCPGDIFRDDYTTFTQKRAGILLKAAYDLMGI